MQKTIYCDEYGRLLRWLKLKRQKENLTLRQLAERLNVHHSRIGRIETGERRLDVFEFIRYCAALKADPHEGLDCLLPNASSVKEPLIASEKANPAYQVEKPSARKPSKK